MADDDDKQLLWQDEEPVSPAARLLKAPGFNLHIMVLIGLKTPVTDLDTPMRGFEETFLKHPRFTSVLVVNGENQAWRRTKVKMEDHTIIPDLDPDMDCPDEFVEDYVSTLTTTPMDMTKPLWEMHILNVKTSDASSSIIFRIHHAMGDGVSLIALLLACTRKSSDPQSLPTLPVMKKRVFNEKEKKNGFLIWRSLVLFCTKLFMIILYTFMDIGMFLATLLFVKDTETPVKGPSYGDKPLPKRFVHRIVSLEDVKLVKTAMNGTINDVILGVTQAGISVYLNRRYGELGKKCLENDQRCNYLPSNTRLTAAVVFNNRQSPVIEDLGGLIKKASVKGIWGNEFGYVLLPFTIGLQDDPLTYVYRAKALVDRKKLSLESKCTFLASQLILKFFGMKIANALNMRVMQSTTLLFSNVVGPQEEVTFYGYPISYISPSLAGVPQALTIHYQSYDSKLIISVAVDEAVIPDPHQLCDDFEESLENMKVAVIKTKLVKGSLD